jgi:pimeloyl-ACP methyl ester carboxylesterase
MTQVTVQNVKTQFVTTRDGIQLAYRIIGPSTGVPLLFLMHFRGTIDHWDPLLIDNFTKHRQVILFDNAGVGHSSGPVDDNINAMAAHIIEFLELLQIKEVDVLGFNLGGVVAPLIGLNVRPGLVRKLILAGTTATAGPGLEAGRTDEGVHKHAFGPVPDLDNFQSLFFEPTETSQAAGRRWWDRIHERNKESSGEERKGYVSEGMMDGGAGMMASIAALTKAGDVANAAEGTYNRLADIKIPVLVAQGHRDIMVPTVNSFQVSQKLPNAWLLIYPDSGHGFMFQHPEEFVKQANAFLDEW